MRALNLIEKIVWPSDRNLTNDDVERIKSTMTVMKIRNYSTRTKLTVTVTSEVFSVLNHDCLSDISG